MAFNKSMVLVLALSSLLSFYAEAGAPAPGPSGPVDAALERVCQKADYYPECMTLIPPFLTAGAPVYADAVLQAGLKAIADQLQKAINEARKLKSGPKIPELDDILNQCLGHYDIAVRYAKKSLDAVVARNYANLESDLDYIVTMAEESDDAFTDQPTTQEQPLDNINSNLIALARNNLAIAGVVAKPRQE